MARYVQPRPRGLFDTCERLDELHAMGDPLARLDQVMNWNVFLPVLERIPRRAPKGPGGRPAYPPLLMFKALVIQSLYNLGDAQLQFQIIDRLSFQRFLGLTEADPAPDEKTFWAFRHNLTRHGLVDQLFATFHQALEAQGLFARQGQIIDATFVEVPRPHNSRRKMPGSKRVSHPKLGRDSPPRPVKRTGTRAGRKKMSNGTTGIKIT